MENQYRDEMTIDLMDMVFYFLKKWKSLVAVLLVCAVLGGAYAAVQPAAEEVAEFVPKADVLKNMEDAFQLRTQYEQMLDQCLKMELDGDMQQYDAMLASAERYQTMMMTLEKTFTGDNLTYYQEHYLGIIPVQPETETQTDSVGAVKFVVIGVFLGVVLWGVWYLVAYLTNGTVKTAEEMAESCGITLLGRVAVEKKGKGLDKLLAKWQEKTKRPAAAVSYLAAVIDGAQDGQVVLCGDQAQGVVKALMAELEQGCSKVQASGFLSESEDALKLAKQAGSEILVVCTWKTRRAQILRELEMCQVQNVKVLGMIVID